MSTNEAEESEGAIVAGQEFSVGEDNEGNEADAFLGEGGGAAAAAAALVT